MDLGINLINKDTYLTNFLNKDTGPTRLVGKMSLSQKFIKIFLTRPGTDIYTIPLEGKDVSCGFLDFLDTVTDNTPITLIKVKVIGFIKDVKNLVIEQQLKYNVVEAERLSSAEMNDVYRDPNTGLINVEIILENATGEKFRTLIDTDKIVNFR